MKRQIYDFLVNTRTDEWSERSVFSPDGHEYHRKITCLYLAQCGYVAVRFMARRQDFFGMERQYGMFFDDNGNNYGQQSLFG